MKTSKLDRAFQLKVKTYKLWISTESRKDPKYAARMKRHHKAIDIYTTVFCNRKVL